MPERRDVPRWQRALGWVFHGVGLFLLLMSAYLFVESGYSQERLWLTVGQLPIAILAFLTGARLVSGSWNGSKSK